MQKGRMRMQFPWFILERSAVMSKAHHSIKQEKKKPLLTPKEKKLAKQAKKQQENAPAPLITH